jgi:uncharacterized membrane protein
MVPGLNVPLVGVAFAAYLTVAVLSFTGKQDSNSADSSNREATLFLTTAMATFSCYLMLVLHFVLHASCNYCYLSASLSAGMAVLAWNNGLVRNPAKAAVVSLSSAALATASSAFLFYATGITLNHGDAAEASTAPAFQAMVAAAEASKAKSSGSAQEAAVPSTARSFGAAMQQREKGGTFAPPAIKAPSSSRALAIGKRLQALDAKMYGAYWCSHCNNQKQELGVQVAKEEKMFAYVECDKQGVDSQYSTCKALKDKVPGYPTWEIAGKYYPGEKSLEELESLLDTAEGGVPATAGAGAGGK